MSHEIFISYSGHDQNIADSIYTTLENSGFSCWIASHDIPESNLYPVEIEKAIKGSSCLIVVVSSHADASRNVNSEVSIAFNNGVAILPFIVEPECSFENLHYHIHLFEWVAAYNPSIEENIRRLPDIVSNIKGSNIHSGKLDSFSSKHNVVVYSEINEFKTDEKINNILYYIRSAGISVKDIRDLPSNNNRLKSFSSNPEYGVFLLMCTEKLLHNELLLSEIKHIYNLNKIVIPLFIDDHVQNQSFSEDYLQKLQQEGLDLSNNSSWVTQLHTRLDEIGIDMKTFDDSCPIFVPEDIEKVAVNLKYVENRPNMNILDSNFTYSTFEALVCDLNSIPVKEIPKQCLYVISGLPGVGKTTQLLLFTVNYLKWINRECRALVYLNPLALQSALEEIKNYDPSKTIFVIDALCRRENDDTFIQKCKFLLEFIAKTGSKFIISLRDYETDKLRTFVNQNGFGPILKVYNLHPDSQIIPYIAINYFKYHSIDLFNGTIRYDEAIDIMSSTDCSVNPELQDAFLRSMKIIENKSEGVPYYIACFVDELIEKNKSFSPAVVQDLPQGVTNLILDTFERVFNEQVIISLFVCLSYLDDFSTPTLNLFFQNICDFYEDEDVDKNILKYQLAEFHSRFCVVVDDPIGDLQRLPSYWIDTILLCLKSNIQNYSNYEVVKLMKNWAYEVNIETFIDQTFQQEIENKLSRGNKGILLITADAVKRDSLIDFVYEKFLSHFKEEPDRQPPEFNLLKRKLISKIFERALISGNSNNYERAVGDFTKILMIDRSNIRAWCNKIDAMRVSDYNKGISCLESEISLIDESLQKCGIEEYVHFLRTLTNIDLNLFKKYVSRLDIFVNKTSPGHISNAIQDLYNFEYFYNKINDVNTQPGIEFVIDPEFRTAEFILPEGTTTNKNIIKDPKLLWECCCQVSPVQFCKVHNLPDGEYIGNSFGSSFTRIIYDDVSVFWFSLGGIWPPSFDSLHLAQYLKSNGYTKNDYNSILDLGCGTGFLGIYLGKKNPAIKSIYMSDWNVNACRLAEYNALRNGLDNERFSIHIGAGYRPFKNEHFDLVVVQPPYLPLLNVFSSHLCGSSNGTELLQTSITRGQDFTDELVISLSEIAMPELRKSLEQVNAHMTILGKTCLPFRVPHALESDEYISMLVNERGLKALNKEGFPYWHDVYTLSIKFY